jgi:arylsulfatase A-like enzyme
MRIFLSLLFVGILATRLAAQEKSPPNIILIFADDLGWKDVGYNGTDFYQTPNIDALAKSGMVFDNAYAAAGNCAPSRACLLSGTYTPRHHVYAVGSTDRGPKKSKRLIPIPNKSGLAKDNITVADALKSAGYTTGIFGKWHLDGPDGAKPAEQGFDVVFDSQKGSANELRDRPNDPKGIFSITREAGKFMEASHTNGKPFFAYVAHHAIHTALEARQSTIEKFQAANPGAQHNHVKYAACLYDLDAGVGELLEKLKSLGIADNTLVVFTSDNGGTQQSSQEPLRGNKGGYYEGGIREPFIAHWHGVIKPGATCSVPVINIDLYPTFLAAAGVAVPEGTTLDGESLLPLFAQTGSLKRESIFWHFPGYLDGPVIRGREEDVRLGFRTRPVSIIRKGDWKLHLFHEEWQLDGGRADAVTSGAIELYNMANDFGEHNNLAATEPAHRDELLNDLLAWFDATHALLPSEKNPAYDPDKTPQPATRRKNRN